MRIDVARPSGYKEGSVITQILRRLEGPSGNQPLFSARITGLESEASEA